MLVDRDTERGVLESVLEDAAQGRARALVLVGEQGAGKTALLATAAQLARERGAHVVQVRAVESDRAIPGAGVSLIVSALADATDLLDPDLADVLRATLRGVVDHRLPGAVLELVGRAAEQRPLVLLVDDAQWWDHESLEALMFAARRLSADDVAVLVAVRSSADDAPALRGARRIRIAGLGRVASVALLQQAAPDMVVDVAESLVDALGGNPSALLEAAALLPDRVRTGTLPLPDPVPVGGVLSAHWARVLDGLPAPTRAALAILAADSSGTENVVRAAWAVAGCDDEDLVAAEECHAVTLGPQGWALPDAVARAAAFSALTPPERRAAHQALATALAGTGRDALYAHHLAESRVGPHSDVADELARLADSLAAEGSVVVAATTAEQAARLTPPGDAYAQRLLRAAELTLLARDEERATTLAEQGLTLGAEPAVAARFRRVLGVAVGHQRDTRRGVALLRQAARDLDAVQRAGALVDALALVKMWNDPEASREILTELGDLDGLDPGMLLDVGNTLAAAGAWSEALPLLQVGLRDVDPGGPAVRETVADAWADAAGLVGLESLRDRYREVATRLVDSGSVLRSAAGLAMEVELAYADGRWAEAVRISDALHDLDRALGRFPQFSVGAGMRIAARRGEQETFDRLEEELRRSATSGGLRLLLENARGLRAMLLVSLGEHDAAEPLLRECLADAPPGMPVTTIFPSAAVTLVAHLARTGRGDEARDLVDETIDRLTVQPSHLAAGYAERLLAHGGPPDEAEEHFLAATALTDQGMHAFEAARTRLEHAQWLRRRRRRSDAVEALVPALAAFDSMACRPWAATCLQELRAAGVDTTRTDPYDVSGLLTAQERQVAAAAAAGLTNAAIARRMYLSPKTVELHLTHVYRKLGISGRSQVAEALAGRVGALAP